VSKPDETTTVSTALDISSAGSLRLTERAPPPTPDATGYVPPIELIDNEADVSLAIRIEQDQPYDTVTIEMCSFDDKNEETGRSFNSTMQITLSLAHITAVRHFLSYLIDARALIMPT
jgi:hypothetical protein